MEEEKNISEVIGDISNDIKSDKKVYDEYRFNNRSEYMKLLDSTLPKRLEKSRSLSGSKKSLYYPIEVKEAVADNIFHYWNVVSEQFTQIQNELVCTVKLVYMPDYPGADELFCTGSAAVPVQMDANSKVTDYPKNKKLNALEYNLPGVRSESIGAALLTLGNIFGRSLNRKVPDDFSLRRISDKKVEKKKTEQQVTPPVKETTQVIPEEDLPF
jgi:hypothetical protein